MRFAWFIECHQAIGIHGVVSSSLGYRLISTGYTRRRATPM
jgi:hypothetical protein